MRIELPGLRGQPPLVLRDRRRRGFGRQRNHSKPPPSEPDSTTRDGLGVSRHRAIEKCVDDLFSDRGGI